MPAITDKFTGEPVLKLQRLGHGTLETVDIARARRFYEEVLGLEVIQPSSRSMMIRLGTNHAYAVVETGKESTMSMLAHNGLDVGSSGGDQQMVVELAGPADDQRLSLRPDGSGPDPCINQSQPGLRSKGRGITLDHQRDVPGSGQRSGQPVEDGIADGQT